MLNFLQLVNKNSDGSKKEVYDKSDYLRIPVKCGDFRQHCVWFFMVYWNGF